MRRRTVALTLVVAPLVACSKQAAEKTDTTTPPAAVAAPAVNTKADEDSIRAIMSRLQTAMNAGDTSVVTAVYTDDAVDFTPGMAPAQGRAALAKEYAEIFGAMKGLKASFGTSDVMVSQSGDLAISHGSYQMSYTDAKGKPATERGNVIAGWKKVDGQWKMAASMNAPEPSTAAK
jgi:uncharacterized protein (TIGR02246 family)